MGPRLHVVDAPGECINFDDPPQVKQLKEQLAWATSQLARLETPSDVARTQRLETALTEVIEWLDFMVETEQQPTAELTRFCETLAVKLRETLFGAEQENANGPDSTETQEAR